MTLHAISHGMRGQVGSYWKLCIRTIALLLSIFLSQAVWVGAHDNLPIVDLHFHAEQGWNFQALVDAFDQAGVVRGCNGAKGTDNLGLSFAINLPDRYLPYGGQGNPLRALIRDLGEQAWNLKSQAVLDALDTLERRLRNGLFSGIGELFPNNLNSHPANVVPTLYPANSPLMQRLWKMSIEFQVPLSVHMENASTSVQEMEELLASDRRGTWIWAHAGVFAQPSDLRPLLEAHPNLYIELSTRDPRRSLLRRVVDQSGNLREDWRELFEDFPDRFVIGTDVDDPNPVEYAFLIAFWRRVLDQLSGDAAAEIAHRNAERLSFCDQRVRIDIKPDDFTNTINPKGHGKVPVAILSTRLQDGTLFFDAPSRVDPDSLTFGRTGDEESLAFCNFEDVNGDGLLDLLCHFSTEETEFKAGDTVGVLRGKTFGGTPLRGQGPVRIVPLERREKDPEDD